MMTPSNWKIYMDKQFLLKFDITIFKHWLSQGVQSFSFDEDYHNTSSNQEVPIFYIRIPQKYYIYIDKKEPVNILIDEIEQISMETDLLTDEWRARFSNLGESWLPFSYINNLSEYFFLISHQNPEEDNQRNQIIASPNIKSISLEINPSINTTKKEKGVGNPRENTPRKKNETTTVIKAKVSPEITKENNTKIENEMKTTNQQFSFSDVDPIEKRE